LLRISRICWRRISAVKRAGAAAPQHLLAARTEDLVHAVRLGQLGRRGPIHQRHSAEARLRALTHLQFEGEPAGFQQRLDARVAVDVVPHLGVGVLGALLDRHAAVAVRDAGRVRLDPGQKRELGVLAVDAAVSVDRHHVLADHHRDAEPSGLPGSGRAEVHAGHLRGAEG